MSIHGINVTRESRDAVAKKVAVVGAGALGQPFGYHISEAGASVTYVVKEKYREEASRGFGLYQHGLFGDPTHIEFTDFEVQVDYGPLSEVDWDQVWLCLSSTAIRGDWLEEFLEAVGETTLVSIQPGLGDREYLEQQYPAERIVSGRVSMIAYPTPLPGGDLPEGEVAYFLPPGEPMWLGGGEPGRAEQVAEMLNAGGCKADVRDDVRSYTMFTGALLETAVAGLELADWSLSEFRKGPTLDLALEAGREAIDIVADYYDTSPPMGVRLGSSASLMKIGLPMASFVMPFDLEAYLEEHFTKVGDQTRHELETFAEEGRSRELPVEALTELRERLGAAPGER
jgi:2-dehydropantoate 2-reductase